MSVNAVDKTTGNTTPLAGNVNDKVGNLASLTTSTKSTAVAAINELNSTKQAKTDSGLTTTAKTVVGAINELKSGLIDRVLNGSNVTKVEIELVQNASNYFPAINLYTSDSTYYQVIWNTSTDVNKLSCNYFDGTNWTTIAEK